MSSDERSVHILSNISLYIASNELFCKTSTSLKNWTQHFYRIILTYKGEYDCTIQNSANSGSGWLYGVQS